MIKTNSIKQEIKPIASGGAKIHCHICGKDFDKVPTKCSCDNCPFVTSTKVGG